MIAFADERAALAWLAALLQAVNGDDPAIMLRVCQGAIDFYKQLVPETTEDYEAIGYALDAISATQVRAACLLELRGEIAP